MKFEKLKTKISPFLVKELLKDWIHVDLLWEKTLNVDFNIYFTRAQIIMGMQEVLLDMNVPTELKEELKKGEESIYQFMHTFETLETISNLNKKYLLKHTPKELQDQMIDFLEKHKSIQEELGEKHGKELTELEDTYNNTIKFYTDKDTEEQDILKEFLTALREQIIICQTLFNSDAKKKIELLDNIDKGTNNLKKNFAKELFGYK
jgi:hypothetical protein|tara:strand:- start:1451 stop:2068 length:618 start_codon:yes stop_codon:yes gene_type:complete